MFSISQIDLPVGYVYSRLHGKYIIKASLLLWFSNSNKRLATFANCIKTFGNYISCQIRSYYFPSLPTIPLHNNEKKNTRFVLPSNQGERVAWAKKSAWLCKIASAMYIGNISSLRVICQRWSYLKLAGGKFCCNHDVRLLPSFRGMQAALIQLALERRSMLDFLSKSRASLSKIESKIIHVAPPVKQTQRRRTKIHRASSEWRDVVKFTRITDKFSQIAVYNSSCTICRISRH